MKVTLDPTLLFFLVATPALGTACGGSDGGEAPVVISSREPTTTPDGGKAIPLDASHGVAADARTPSVDDARTGVAGSSCSSKAPCDVGLDCVSLAAGPTCVPPAGPKVTYAGGRLQTAMEVWTVVWTGDEALGTTINDFTGNLLEAEWWQAASEYGIGLGKAMGVIVAGPPPARLAENGSDYDTIISNVVGQTTLEGDVVPLPNENTVFSFIVPKGTKAPGGYYHYTTNHKVPNAAGSSIYVPYAVDPQDSVGFVTDMQYLTWSISHELIETATDPMVQGGWNADSAGSNSEVADLCNDIPTTIMLGGAPQMVTRFWSAKTAATRIANPCLPLVPGPYMNVALAHELIAVPTSKNVHLVPFSFGPSAPMHWQVYTNAFYDFSPASGTSSPGDDVVVEVKRKADAPDAPSWIQVWVTDPSMEDASMPAAEWFGGLIPGGS
jgi:hypothetical protein